MSRWSSSRRPWCRRGTDSGSGTCWPTGSRRDSGTGTKKTRAQGPGLIPRFRRPFSDLFTVAASVHKSPRVSDGSINPNSETVSSFFQHVWSREETGVSGNGWIGHKTGPPTTKPATGESDRLGAPW